MIRHEGLGEDQGLDRFIDRKMMELRVCMPGVIQAFDPATQTVTAQPSIKMKAGMEEDGSMGKYVDLPPILKVPLVIPYAQDAGLLLTLPIRPGDECLLLFADRAIDYVAEHGGVQPPPIGPMESTSHPRAHHLTDAICIPGFIAERKAVPAYSTENIEMRDRERKHFISLGPSGITITDGDATIRVSGGVVNIDAPGGLVETSQGPMSRTTPATQSIAGSNVQIGGDGGGNTFSGPLHATGPVSTDADVSNGAATTLGTHTHGGILPGGGDTAQPNSGS